MAALASGRPLPTTPLGNNVYDLTAATQFYGGGLVGLTSAGLLIPWRNTATDVFVGIVLQDGLEPTVDVLPVSDRGAVVKNIPVASAAQGSVGLQVHCTTDNILENATLDGGATSRGVGVIIRYRSASDCDVQLYSVTDFSARYSQATT